ncbi:MAG: HEAT repeat domain-containing protein [Planctomycetaceae bacterium]
MSAVRTDNLPVSVLSSAGSWLENDDDEQREATPEQSNGTSTADASALENLVSDFMNAGGAKRDRICDRLIDRITTAENPAAQICWTLYLILDSAKPGRVDDCIGILQRLGFDRTADAALETFTLRPPFPEMGSLHQDYWYAFVRALGRYAGEFSRARETIRLASRFPVSAMREAAAEVLAELGDKKSITQLREMATDDPSPLVQRICNELLAELIE